MAIKVDTVDVLKRYFSAVVGRANHHAPNVTDVIYRILGIIVLKKDTDRDIEVKEIGDGHTGNILWVWINGTRYAFRYEHSDGTIEIRKGSYAGPLVIKIDNATSTQDILDVL